MSPSEINEIHHRARQDAFRFRMGWTVVCPYHRQEEVDLYNEVYAKALKEPK